MGTRPDIQGARGIVAVSTTRRAIVKTLINAAPLLPTALILFLSTITISGQQAAADWAQLSARLTQMMSSGDPEIKRTALGEIRNLESEQASRIAVKGLSDSNELVRATAAAAVVYLPRGEAGRLLAPLLRDKSPFVRREAGYALSVVKDETSADAIWQAFQKEKDLEVRSALVIALGGIGTSAAVGYLNSILQLPRREENEFIRRSAARSIGQNAETIRAGSSALIRDKQYSGEHLRSLDLTTISPALAAGAIKLRSILNDNSASADVRREAAYALGAIGDVSARPILEANANSTDPFIAANSKNALTRLAGIKPL